MDHFNVSIKLHSLIVVLVSGILFLGTINFGCCQDGLSVGCSKIEKEALLNFKEGLTDPAGKLSSWVGQDCCRWRGVSCDNRSRRIVKLNLRNTYADSFDGNGTVTELGGKINPSLLHLEELEYLDLSMNNFGGVQIPTFIGALQRLRYLNLSGAAFGGIIPPTLGNLSSLRYLDLHNDFSELSTSDLQWLPSLPSLKYLNLGGVDLSEAAAYWVEIINALPSLVELHLFNCRLSRLTLRLPILNLTSLLVLDLSNNGFNSAVPLWLFNITSLEHLDLNSNNLQGQLSNAWENLNSLKQLDLSQNSYIEGPLSRSLGKLCNLQILKLSVNKISGETTEFFNGLSQCNNSSLESLDLGYNELSGNLPESLGYLKNLRYLQLWHNSFQGSIPRSIGNLSSLKEIYLTDNEMRGSFPESLGQLSSLNVLELNDNPWEGVITEAHFVNLSSLKQMSLYKDSSNISLAFNISSDWIPPFKLTFIRIRSCQLGTKFPAWLRNQDELITLILNNVKISDTIPDWFLQMGFHLDELDIAYNQLRGRIPNTFPFLSASVLDLSSNQFEGPLPLWSSAMTKLYLRDNRFSGPIPHDIGEIMPFLTDLDISINSLNGSIPLSIGNLNGLITLVMSNNYLSGEIPRFWNNTLDLYIMDLSNNGLSGTIPASIGSVNYLRFLILSNNNLSGKPPPSLQNCSLLDSLDLGDNRFSGNLPGWIGKSMSSLLILRLRGNFFSGNIPSTICGLSNLHIVDLSHNNLSGRIPACVGNLTGLKSELTEEDTETYQGKLEIVAKGRVLEYYSTLYLVNSLDLSNNNLSGEIPTELTSLTKVGTLNLSMNHLTGSIPLEIGNLEWIETLDLSRNNLSGPIPPSMTRSTFLNHLNLSYNNLSGKIPTSNQFQTLNDPSIYEGNPALCGLPLPTECSNNNKPTPSPDEKNKDNDGDNGDDDSNKLWFFGSIAVGFIVGFWGVCGTLIVKKSWRHAYFRFVEEKKDALLVILTVNARRLKGKICCKVQEE